MVSTSGSDVAYCDDVLHHHDDCLHHVHDDQSIADRLAIAEQQCAQRGVRLTALRKEVLLYILSSPMPIGAYDVLAKLTHHTQRAAAPPTVYRALDFLLNQGLIHRLSSVNAYVPCCHPRAGHQAVFLICQHCRQVQETSAHGVLNALADIAADGHFKALTSVIEISGICQQCHLQQP